MIAKLIEKWGRFIRMAVSLRGGTDVDGTIKEISANSHIRGANVWLLICSALLSSIGLDLNSTAVIIGAMLISPLMSPILGVGLGIAILDRKLLRSSFLSLSLATLLSLVTSTIYFFFSPLGEITSELSARTTPTLLDVGVAFFGGVAGIVAGSRFSKTSAIPGVAIATALMPPICTVGFGLAKGDSTVFLGAFYLYSLNAFFISLSTYLIALYLRFPKRAELDGERSVMVRRLIVAFAVLVTIPSGIIFYNVLQKLRFDRGVKTFVSNEIQKDERQPIRWNVDEKSVPQVLKVYTVGTATSPDEREELKNKMSSYGIGNLGLKIVRMNISQDEFRKLSSSVESDVSERFKIISSIDEQQENELTSLKADLEKLKNKTDPDILFLDEVRRRFPQIESAEWKAVQKDDQGTASNDVRTIVITFKPDTAVSSIFTTRSSLETLMRERWPNQSISVESQQFPAAVDSDNDEKTKQK